MARVVKLLDYEEYINIIGFPAYMFRVMYPDKNVRWHQSVPYSTYWLTRRDIGQYFTIGHNLLWNYDLNRISEEAARDMVQSSR